MNETTNVHSAPNIAENTLLNGSGYILNKKFCFATVPAIIAVLNCMWLSVMGSAVFISDIYFGKDFQEIIALAGISVCYSAEFIAMVFLCVLMFKKINKPIMSAPMFIAAFGYFFNLITAWILVMAEPEFEVEYDSPRFDHYSYSDYLKVRYAYMLSDLILVLIFVIAAVYMILAARKNSGEKIKKLWVIPSLIPLTYALSIVGYVADYNLYWSEMIRRDEVLFTEWSGFVSFNLILFILISGMQFITIFMLCKWISNPYKKMQKEESPSEN